MAMRLARGGAAVALVSIPLRYMHSAVETLSLDDVEKTIEVVRLALLNMPADVSFKR
jgi:endoglucanase